MAAYLALRHKVTGETYSGGKLVAVDEMLRAALGAEPDPVNWFAGWMNWAGQSMAMRYDKPIADSLSHFMVHDKCFGDPEPVVLAVCDWFIANFENDSFHRIGGN